MLGKTENLPLPISIIVTVVAYVILSFVFLRERPAPTQSEFLTQIVAILPQVIAVVNASALVFLVVGWRLIRSGYVKLHRIAMLSALILISLFLVLYVTRVYLGGIKEFPGPETLYYFVYLPILIIHLTLSVLCVQPVVYVALIGLTHRIDDIPGTKHRLVGRIVVPMWIFSLFLGLIVYVMLNRSY
ncbi:MAG: DUF420 domain-containing protein [Candidatus Binatia bacterium]